MPVFPVKAANVLRVAGAFFAGVVMMTGVSAWAQGTSPQTDRPMDLAPPVRLVPPVKKAQPQPASPVQSVPDTSLPSVFGGTVSAEPLAQINPDVAGVLLEKDGGFGPAMWRGADQRVIETLLPQLPVTSPSPAMRDLMRRLLLTGAEVPKGIKPGTLISLRARELAAMGDFAGVNALLGVVPGYRGNPDLLRVEMNIRLLTGDVARACQVANANIQTQKSVYWQQTFNFCQALDGQTASAQLGLSLLDELGVKDPVYTKLVNAIINRGKPPVIASLPDPTPLQLALARVANAKLPADVISSNRLGVLRAIAISPNANAELRLEAAERAEAAGALPVATLRQLYASIRFSAQELKNPMSAAARRSGPMSRALLYRATLMQTVPAAQAEALQSALKLAREGGRYASTVRAFLPQLTRLKPSADLVWFAPEAIRAFLIIARYPEATGWFNVLKEAALSDPKMASALESLMPMARLSGFKGADDWSMDRLSNWWTSVKSMPDARRKGAVLAAALAGLGEYVPDDMWLKLIDGPTHKTMLAPYPSLWFLLDNASTQARVGETVLLSLIVIGEGGPARAEPIVLYRVLKSLRFVGLDREARALALESVVAAGI